MEETTPRPDDGLGAPESLEMQQTQMMQMLQVQQPILEENQVDEVSEGSFMIMIKPAARQVSTAPVQRLCSV